MLMVPAKNCDYCGAELVSTKLQSHCGDVHCRMKWYREQHSKARGYFQQKKERLEKKKKALYDQHRANSVVDEVIPVVELPHCGEKAALIDHERVDSFTEHLEKLLASLDDVIVEKQYKPHIQNPESSHMSEVLAAMCALCNGKCCNKGNEHHAYIQRSTLLRAINNNDELDRENILSVYKANIPQKSIENSCLFHTESGCCLAPGLRAEICSEFFCSNLSEYISTYQNREIPTQHLAVAVREYDIVESKIVYRNGESKVPTE